MGKPDNKDRVEAHLEKDKMKVLVQLAKKDNRTLKNYVETILLKHIEQHDTAPRNQNPD